MLFFDINCHISLFHIFICKKLKKLSKKILKFLNYEKKVLTLAVEYYITNNHKLIN